MKNSSHSSHAQVNRRSFLQATAAVTAGVTATGLLAQPALALGASSKPAILGGTPVHSGKWPSWPIVAAEEREPLLQVLESGDWNRYRAGDRGKVAEFERRWAEDVGVKHALAVNSGTSALVTALAALDIGPGDEVIVPPYTFAATINSVLVHHALPVFVDSDFETAQLDATKIEASINENTRAILPVHLAGATCDMDRIMAIANKHNLKVVEDACQAHTAQWKEKRVGSIGDVGCFSFQNSKNLASGDGGALTTNNADLFAQAQVYQNNGFGAANALPGRTTNGMNLRVTEFQGAVLLGQFSRHNALARQREANAKQLDSLLASIPGLAAKKVYPGTTCHGYHLYMFDFESEQFAGMSKDRFLQALRAEGVPVSGGYNALNKQPLVEGFLNSRGFKRIYSPQRLQQYREANQMPENDRLIASTCWLGQNILLGSQQDIERIGDAMARIQKHAAEIAKG